MIDPREEGLSEKELYVMRDYFEFKNKDQDQGASYDMGAMINLFKDDLEKILELPEFADPQQRVGLRQKLQEVFDEYIPKSTR